VSADRTRQLIDQLAADAAPVAPLPRLRTSVAWLVGLGLVIASSAVALLGNASTERLSDATFPAVLAGLACVAVGGCLAGLASAVPGRDAARRSGLALAAAGAVAALGSVLLALPGHAGPGQGFYVEAAYCVGSGVSFSLVPVALAVWLARRAWVLSPWLTTAMLLLGTTAGGAVAVQLICPLSDPWHVLLGHDGVPLIATAIAAPLVAPWVRRFAG